MHFDVITSDANGAAIDADSTPTFAVYEEATDTDIGVGGNLTKRTSLTGNYRGTFTVSAANGFELGKFYNVIASATVGGVAAKCVAGNFRIIAAEHTAGYNVATIKDGTGTGEIDTTSGGVLVAAIAANAITATSIAADAITAAKIAAGAIDAATFAADVDAEILSYIVNDATQIDASALNTATGTTIPAILDDTDLIDDGTSGLAKIATDVAAILVDTAEIGTAGAGLTNINLPNQTMDIVGNITGNLSGSVGSVSGAVGSVTGAVGSVTGNVGGNVVGSVGSVAGNVSGSIGSLATQAKADVNAEADAAISDAGLVTKIDTIDDFLDTEISAILADTNELQTDWVNGGRLDLIIDAINAKTTNLPSDPADASDIAASFGTVASAISGLNNLSAAQVNAEVDTALADVGLTTTITGRIDVAISTRLASASYTAPDNTSITAIKAKTDSLAFTVSGKVDSNIYYVNGTQIQGDGNTGTEWGPV